MGTRSIIAIKNNDGTVTSVNCHWDGYLEHNGRLLTGHYNTEKKARALIEKGNISLLAESIDQPEGHTFNKPVPGYTIFYGRDRNEDDHDPVITAGLELDDCCEYYYLFKDGEWYYSKDGGEPMQRVLADLMISAHAP